MTGSRRFGAALLACLTFICSSAHAGEGVTVYATPNCYIFETKTGFVLFERSGGQGPEEGQTVVGTLDDYGFQELKDTNGRDIIVGWITNHGVSDEAEIADFKKVCR